MEQNRISPADEKFLINLYSGGQLEKLKPSGANMVTIEAYPLRVASGDIETASSLTGFFDLFHAEDSNATTPFEIDATLARSKFRLSVLWTDKTGIEADAEVPAANEAKRIILADGFIISVKPSFTDGILKYTIVYKVNTFDSSGSSNVRFQSHDGSGGTVISALGNYTTSNKF